MGRRAKRALRCERCRLHVERCICAEIPSLALETRVVLVMHRRERHKTTATGPLALAALPNSECCIHGVANTPLDLAYLKDPNRRVLLLFPSDKAQPIDSLDRSLDARPITLVVPDGSWNQARRMHRRIPGLDDVPHVTLPTGKPSAWGIRREPNESGLATFEAIARALGILESPEVEERLSALFSRIVDETFAARGNGIRRRSLSG